MSDLSATRRAAWVVTMHTGGCSACAQSLAALAAPRYAKRLNALGITLARAPRHSDVILLCGALTEQARASVSALLDGIPHPRAVVAVGDCAINGCVFAGAPGLTTPLAQAFNANVVIGGCPPSPLTIIDAIAEARRLLSVEPAATGVTSLDSVESGAEAAPDALSAPTRVSTDEPAAAPDRATRLAALFDAAGEGWDGDDEDGDEGDDIGEPDDAHGLDDTLSGHAIEANEEHHQLNGSGATMPGVRDHKEKRR